MRLRLVRLHVLDDTSGLGGWRSSLRGVGRGSWCHDGGDGASDGGDLKLKADADGEADK